MSAALHPLLSINGHPLLAAAPWMVAAAPLVLVLVLCVLAAQSCRRFQLDAASQGVLLGGAGLTVLGMVLAPLAPALAGLARNLAG